MFGQFLVFFHVPLKLLALATAEGAKYLFSAFIQGIITLKHAHLFRIANHLIIRRIHIAFAERQIVDGVKQIRFPHAVIAEKAIHLGREMNLRLKSILVS
jgi:hypothetical protein